MKNIKRGLVVILSAIILLVVMLASAFAAPDVDLSSDMIISVPDVTHTFEGDMPAFSNTSVFDAVSERTLQYYNNNIDANKYLRIRSLESGGTIANSDGAYLGVAFGTSAYNCVDKKYGFIQNDYAVFDFDICADSYVDSNGKLTTAEYDAQGNKNNLAYPAPMQIALFYRINSTTNIGDGVRIEVRGDATNGYYLSYNGGGINKTRLPDKINEWTHVTLVYEIDNSVTYFSGEDYTGEPTIGDYDSETVLAIQKGECEEYKSFTCNLSKTKLHMYVDGVYVGTDTAVLYPEIDNGEYWSSDAAKNDGGIERAGLYAARMYPKNGGGTIRYSYGLDNLAYNLYRNGYDGELATHLKNNLEEPLYYLSDVVYNKSYDAPDGTPEKSALYIDVDELDEITLLEKAGGYGVALGALSEISAYQYAVLGCSVENYYPTCEFYVSVPEGESFTTAGDSGYEVSKTPVSLEIDGKNYDFYFVSEAKNLYTVRWYDGVDMDKVICEKTLVSEAEITFDGEIPEYYHIEGNEFLVFDGWKYAVEYDEHAEPVWADFTSTKITPELIEIIGGTFNELTIAPVYTQKTAYYAITDTIDNVLGYAFDTADRLALDMQAGKSIKLLSDINEFNYTDVIQYNGKVYMGFPENGRAIFDLNGHVLNLDCITYDYAFLLGKSSSLTIRSSLPGGKLICSAGIARGSQYGKGKIFLGTKTDTQNGEANLTVTAKTIFGTQGNLENYAHTVGIYGVNYYTATNVPAINSVSMVTNIEIENSTFYLPTEGAALLGVNAKNKGAINASVKNTTVVSTTEDGSPNYIIRDLGNYALETAQEPLTSTSVTFDNCMLYGTVIPTDNASDKLAPENRGKIYFVGGTKIATPESLPSDVVIAPTSGNTIARVDASKAVTLYTPEGTVELTIDFNYQEQFDIGYSITLTKDNGFFFNFEINKDLIREVYAEIGGDPLVGVEYGDNIRYTIPVPVASIEDVTIYLEMEGKEDLVEISTNLPQYLRSAFKYSTSDEQRALLVNAANYAGELYKFVTKGKECGEFKSFIEANESMLIKADKDAPATAVTDTTVISAVQLMITDGNVPAFAFTKASDGVVSVKYGEKALECKELSVLDVTYYVADGMAIVDMTETFEIYVGENKIGEYSLLNYIQATDNRIANALYGYITAVKNCK